jgi:hypothetical protein
LAEVNDKFTGLALQTGTVAGKEYYLKINTLKRYT